MNLNISSVPRDVTTSLTGAVLFEVMPHIEPRHKWQLAIQDTQIQHSGH